MTTEPLLISTISNVAFASAVLVHHFTFSRIYTLLRMLSGAWSVIFYFLFKIKIGLCPILHLLPLILFVNQYSLALFNTYLESI